MKEGRFESPYEEYAGHIQFPNPIEVSHFKKWWDTVITPQKETTQAEWEYIENPWLGCRDLLLEFGEWQIAGVPIGDVKENRVPLEIMTWVKQCGLSYILPKLDPKVRRLISTIISVENQPFPIGHLN